MIESSLGYFTPACFLITLEPGEPPKELGEEHPFPRLNHFWRRVVGCVDEADAPAVLCFTQQTGMNLAVSSTDFQVEESYIADC